MKLTSTYNKRICYIFAIISLVFASLVNGKEEIITNERYPENLTLKLGVPSNMHLPYWGGSAELPSGIISEIISLLEQSENIDVEYVEYPTEKEASIALSKREIDFSIGSFSKSWEGFESSLDVIRDSVVAIVFRSYESKERLKELNWTCVKGTALCDVLESQGYKNIIRTNSLDQYSKLYNSNNIDASIGLYRSFLYYLENDIIKGNDLLFDPDFGQSSINFFYLPSNHVVGTILNTFIEEFSSEWNYNYIEHLSNEYGKTESVYSNWYDDERNPYIVKYTVGNDLYPYSFFDDEENKYSGIIHDIFSRLSSITPLEFVFVKPRTGEYLKMLESGEVHLAAFTEQNFFIGEEFGVTDSFVNVNYDYIETNQSFNEERIAILDRYGRKEELEDQGLLLYTSEVELIRDINSGSITNAYINSTLLEEMLNEGYEVNFKKVEGDNSFILSFEGSMLNLKSNEKLNHLINESIRMLSNYEVDSIINEYHKKNVTFGYDKDKVTLGVGIFLTSMVIVILGYGGYSRSIKKRLNGANHQNVLSEKQRQWLESIINNIPSSVCIINDENTILLENDSFKELDANLSCKVKALEYLLASVPSLEHKSNDFDVRVEDEGILFGRYFNVKTIELNSKDKPRVYMYIINDITSSKVKEIGLIESNIESKKAIEHKKNFLAVISHELRTPISGIVGLVELLESRVEDKTSKDIIKNVVASAGKLKYLVDDILDFSKLDAEQLKINIEKVNIANELCPTIRSFETIAKKKNLLFVVEWIPSPFLLCNIDPLRVSQIINNVLSNAVKFTEHGFISVQIRLDKSDLKIVVNDSGVGMEDSELASIFDPFVQAKDDIARKHGGTGLGMSIVKNLIELMDGQINISSEKGLGSCIEIIIPTVSEKLILDDIVKSVECSEPRSEKWLQALGINYDLVDNEESFNITTNLYPDELLREVISSQLDSLVSTEDKSSLKPTLKGNILVVEDDAINRFVFQMQLEALGLESTLVDSAESALELLSIESSKFDVVITDLHMPNMNGFELSRTLNDLEQHQLKVPVIACTADNSSSVYEEAKTVGIRDVLNKPYELRELQKILSNYVQTNNSAVITKTMKDTAVEWLDRIKPQNRFLMANAVVKSLSKVHLASDSGKDEIAETVHRLKGALGSIGEYDLVELCLSLESNNYERKMLDLLMLNIEEILYQAHDYLAGTK